MPLFPSVPEDLEAVDADELQGTLDEFKAIGARVQADLALPKDERELIAEMSATDVTEALAQAAETKLRIDEYLAGVAKAEETFTEAVAEGLAKLGVAAEAVEEPAEEFANEDESAEEAPSEDAAEEVAAPTAEAERVSVDVETEVEAEIETPAAPEPAVRMSIPRGPSRLAPQAPAGAPLNGATVVANGGLGAIKVREGTPLTRHDFADAAVALAKKLRRVEHVKGGGREQFAVAVAQYAFPDEFTLGTNQDENLEKIRQVAPLILGNPNEMDVFQASGGICAPPTPFYDVPGFASRERPVRGALPSYNAARGGVSLPSVAIVDRGDPGVTVIEAEEDAQGGTYATKACRDIECAVWSDTFIGIISHCLQVGTLNNRTWPEGVALEVDNLMAGWAATAETRLLDRIRSMSLLKAASSPYNAVHGLVYAIMRASAAISYELRSERDASFTALVPEWVTKLLVSDLAAQSSLEERYVAASQVEQYLSRLGVSVAWYKDAPTGGDPQGYAAVVTGGDLEDFPLSAQIGVFLNGTFIHLDGGSLELGLIRDSELISTNDHELFGESFENVARVGPIQATRWITLDMCPNGQFPALATALACA